MQKFPAQSAVPEEAQRRRWFSNLMWNTFPGKSIRDKAERAAPVLNLSVKQCENLMKMDHDAKLGTILAVLSLAGAENIFDIIGGRKN